MYKKIIAFTLVMCIFLSGCASKKSNEIEAVDNKQEIKVAFTNDDSDKEEKDIEGVTEAEEELEEIVEPVEVVEDLLPTDEEMELFNTLAGGFFYSKSDDKEFELARQGAIDIYNNQVIDLLEECFDLYNELNGYEEQILFFIDDIDKSRTEYKEDFQLILDEILYYKTVINAKIHEANGYFEIIESHDENNINKAVVDGEVFECTVSVYDNLGEYISFLVITSEYLASGIANNFNEIYADSIREYTNAAFQQYVVKSLVEVNRSYLVMSKMYAHIASSDYYEGLEIKEKTIEKLSNMEQTEDVVELLKLAEIGQKIPDYIIEISENTEDEESEEKKISFTWPFGIIVFAEDDINTMAVKFALLKKIAGMYDDEIGLIEYTDDEMLNIIFNAKDMRDKLVKEQIDHVPSLADLNFVVTGLPPRTKLTMREKEFGPNYNANFTMKSNYQMIFEDDDNETSSTQNVEEVKTAHNNIKAVEIEIISMKQRDKFIEELKNVQSSKEALGASAMLILPEWAGGGVDKVYNKIVDAFTDMLSENKVKVNGEAFEKIESLLENDLEEILGEKKFEFANRFLNGSAEEIVNGLSDWINNSRNRKDLKIDKNTLIDMLDAMGFVHEGEKDDNKEVIVDEKDIQEFVFYSQKTGLKSQEHKLYPYEAYIRRDTRKYHKNGSLALVGSYLLTKQAGQMLIEEYISNLKTRESAGKDGFWPIPLEAARKDYFSIGLHESYLEDGKISSQVEFDDEGNVILSKTWYYHDNGVVKKYSELDGSHSGVKITYDTEGNKRVTSFYDHNKETSRINHWRED
ncbi:hypothetical protein [Fusibacter tunisiensis]|uniref:Uncharacterized protein n=1 Tax=Fusibacter tunisiensis TaxID=1008308 RepID=A0ABS2MTZ3_9FIRM|nr:hypothetical protein [Fusibacter tunisiensis]MBM7562820.1 hypothetical protein [Fusibacter tunisiensis]